MSEQNEYTELESIKERYKKFGKLDPYPEIAPSLLNSADIIDYVEKIGMIYPFYRDNLKPASYGVRLKGEYIYWLNKEEKVCGYLENITEIDDDGDKVFILKKNSIAYVQLEPVFRFPSYIAARFNLKIKHIYQGLLLGTGPLVDPGYEGNIYVPLHNLTNNDYKIKINIPFIWMEFTKLSSYQEWNKEYVKSDNRTGIYKHFDKSRLKSKASLSEYINDAHPNAAIVSTISGFFEETSASIKKFDDRIKLNETTVKDTTDSANRATGQFNRAIIVATIAVCTSLVAICVTLGISLYQSISIHNKTIDYLKDYDKKIQEEHSKFIKEETNNLDLKQQLNDLNDKVKKQQEQIDKIKR